MRKEIAAIGVLQFLTLAKMEKDASWASWASLVWFLFAVLLMVYVVSPD